MIKLISTDFDGTLVSFEPEQETPHVFLEWYHQYRVNTDAVWMINTGRWIESVQERLVTLAIADWPLWVGCGERELYRLEGGRYEPVHPWNERCDVAHRDLRERRAEAFDEILNFLENDTQSTVLYERGMFAGCLATSDEEADRIQAYLNQLFCDVTEMSHARNSWYFRLGHCDFHKGSCLNEVRRLLGIRSEETFTCGDHFNDLPMLKPEIARLLARPANAIPEVKSAVTEGKGFVATEKFTLGLVQGLQYFAALPEAT